MEGAISTERRQSAKSSDRLTLHHLSVPRLTLKMLIHESPEGSYRRKAVGSTIRWGVTEARRRYEPSVDYLATITPTANECYTLLMVRNCAPPCGTTKSATDDRTLKIEI